MPLSETAADSDDGDRLVERPIFIVGMGRSGTTLLRTLLSAHPRIAITTETHFIELARLFGGLDKGAPPDYDRFWEMLTRTHRFHDLGIDAARCRELIERVGDRSYRTIFGALLKAYAERTGRARVGEKTPGHVVHIHRLLEWFPSARFLILRRDPRAVVASQLRSPWSRERITVPSIRWGVVRRKRISELAGFAAQWDRTYEHHLAAWWNHDQVHIVAYEDLVQETAAVLKQVCEFIDEPFDPAMISERTESTVPLPESRAPNEGLEEWRQRHFAETLKPVTSNSLLKWKADLSALEIAMTEGICGKTMIAAGYAPISSPLPRITGGAVLKTIGHLAKAEEAARIKAWPITHRLRQKLGIS